MHGVAVADGEVAAREGVGPTLRRTRGGHVLVAHVEVRLGCVVEARSIPVLRSRAVEDRELRLAGGAVDARAAGLVRRRTADRSGVAQ